MSQYLKSNSLIIRYIDRSIFSWKEVDRTGVIRGDRSIKIDESTTVGDILALYKQSKFAQVVKMSNGRIDQVVEPSTKVVQLIADGHIYRVDQYKHTDAMIIEGADTFNVCVKFIGDSPQERLQTPLLLKVSNGARISTIGYHVASLIPGLHPMKIQEFQYQVDGKSVGKEYLLAKPKDSKKIQVVSLDMKQKPKRAPVSYSYKDLV